MVGVVVGDEKSFAQQRLAVSPGKLAVEVLLRVAEQRLELRQVLADRAHGARPVTLFLRSRLRRPVSLRPFRRLIFGRNTEPQNVVLGDAHVLQQLPGGVRKALRPLPGLVYRESADRAVKRG